MALTISTHPDEVITNAPEFTVTTSLTEGASYQNLRIRATVYIGGQADAMAVLEQPKGLDDWDLFDLLKSFTGKAYLPVVGATCYGQPTYGTELLTGWTDLLTTFETFTTSGKEITSAIDSNASGGIAASNNLGAISAGEIFIFGCDNNFSDAGAADEILALNGTSLSNPFSVAKYAGLSSGKLQSKHIYILHATEDDTVSSITIGHSSGANGNFSGNFSLHKITDFKNNPAVYFHIKFEEVYENASDVTTIGDEEWSDAMLFAPVILRPGETFSEYLVNGSTKKFAARSHPTGSTNIYDLKYMHGVDMEFRALIYSTTPYVTLWCVHAPTVPLREEEEFDNMGWTMVMFSDTIAASTPSGYFYFQYYSLNEARTVGNWVSNLRINVETKCYPDVKVLNFVGDLGEEHMMFRGLQTMNGKVEKSFYKNVNRVRKVLKAFRFVRMRLRTVYETEYVNLLLHELLYTEYDVWMFDADEPDGYKVVTVIDDDVTIYDKNNLVENAIEIEYHE